MIERTLVKSQAVSSWERIEYVPDEELNAINSRLEGQPESAELWLQKGLCLAGASLFREAGECFARAIALEPFNAMLYRHWAHRMLSQWRFEDACAGFVIASRLIPENWDPWYHLGVSYYMLGHYAQAEKAMYRCYELLKDQDPRDCCAALDWRWRSLTRLGRKADADELLKCVPEGAECYEGDYGYMLNCSMYKGIVTPEQVYADPRVHSGSMDLMCVTYAVSNCYFCTGNIEKSNEFVDKCISIGKTHERLTFGFMAALADKNARS